MARTSGSRFRSRTVARTVWPAVRSCRIAWLPMNPEPPVTRTVLMLDPPLRSKVPRTALGVECPELRLTDAVDPIDPRSIDSPGTPAYD